VSDPLVAHTHMEIARAEAAARERRRLARIARDERTCSSTENARTATAPAPGRGARGTTRTSWPSKRPEPRRASKEGRLRSQLRGRLPKPDSCECDCAGSSGDGPDYTGPVQVVGQDPSELDGSACESS